MEGMDMSGMSAANVNNVTVAVMNSSSSPLTMSVSTTAQQCSPMLEGFQFAFGSLSSGSSSSPCILYLFPGANVDTPFKYAVAVVFTCFAAIGYELLRARREQLVTYVKSTTSTSLQSPSQTTSSLPDYDVLIAVLYTIQTVLGYFLMMLVMTFDITLFVAISVGFGMGYYWVLRNQRALAMRKETVANYKLMLTPTSASSGTSNPIATNAFTTTPLPTITSAEAC